MLERGEKQSSGEEGEEGWEFEDSSREKVSGGGAQGVEDWIQNIESTFAEELERDGEQG